MKKKKLLLKILSNQRNVSFSDMRSIVEAFGFKLSRISGSHHIYKHISIKELINIQNVKGKAKPYQIKQFLEIVEKYNLIIKED
jgi:predicted RNA binding protein YcfA (HicA-like mRNA interferase family)